jgi:hypothetical protein
MSESDLLEPLLGPVTAVQQFADLLEMPELWGDVE